MKEIETREMMCSIPTMEVGSVDQFVPTETALASFLYYVYTDTIAMTVENSVFVIPMAGQCILLVIVQRFFRLLWVEQQETEGERNQKHRKKFET